MGPNIEISSSNDYTGYVDQKLLLLSHLSANDTDDKGIIFKRGDTNRGVIWDESENEFSFISTNANENTQGAVTVLGYSPIKASRINLLSGFHLTGSGEITGSLGVNVSGSEITHGITLPNESAGTSGMIKAASFLTYSSIRYKKNVESIKEPLEKLKNLRGVTFNWKKSGKKDMGFIVEEIAKELPEVIGYDNEIPSSMDYAKMTSFLLQCVKEQQEQIKSQKKQIDSLYHHLENGFFASS